MLHRYIRKTGIYVQQICYPSTPTNKVILCHIIIGTFTARNAPVRYSRGFSTTNN